MKTTNKASAATTTPRAGRVRKVGHRRRSPKSALMEKFLGLLAIVVLPASLTITFGKMSGRPRAGWLLLAVMVVLFAGGLALCDWAEAAAPPQLTGLHIAGGNMEVPRQIQVEAFIDVI